MKLPSPSQMRALQLLRQGKLIWMGPESIRLEKVDVRGRQPEAQYPLSVDERIYTVTARILVDRGWIEMKGFNPRQGKYELSPKGRELSEQICECRYSGRWGRGTHK